VYLRSALRIVAPSDAESRKPDARFYMTDKRIVLTTVGSEGEAHKIAQHLVEQELAACVNIVPRIESIYRWQGKIESSQEWLLLIKTSAERFSGVRDAIRELHSYELPECIAVDIADSSADYLQMAGGFIAAPVEPRLASACATALCPAEFSRQ